MKKVEIGFTFLKILMCLLAFVMIMSDCSPADVASQNLSTAADSFQVDRRIVFVNGITDKYLMTIEGKCSLGNSDPAREISVTCKTGVDAAGNPVFKKAFWGLSDNVFYMVEQIDGYATDDFHYTVIFRPEVVIPNIQVKTSGNK
jgi:hypothetical protein